MFDKITLKKKNIILKKRAHLDFQTKIQRKSNQRSFGLGASVPLQKMVFVD